MLSLEQSLLVGQLSKAAFVLLWLPFILLVSVALVDPLAAVWTSFALSLLTQMADYWLWRARRREYPMVLSAWSLAAYIFVIILHYTDSPHVSSAFYGPIVLTVLLFAISASVVMGSPFSRQFQRGVDNGNGNGGGGLLLMGQGEILHVHMWLSKLFVGVFVVMTVCSYCSTMFATSAGDPGYLVLGLVVPILLPALAVGLIPCWMRCMPAVVGEEEDIGSSKQEVGGGDGEKDGLLGRRKEG